MPVSTRDNTSRPEFKFDGYFWAVIVFSLVWLTSLPGQLFFGDDARLLVDAQHGGFAGSFPASLFETTSEKYRPVFSALFSLLLPIFGSDHHAYELVSDSILVASSAVMYRICLFLSRDRYAGVACAILFVLSRFIYYSQTQVWGIMESLAVFFLLLIFREMLLAWQAESLARDIKVLAYYLILIFTHERFLALAPALILFYLVASKRRSFVYLVLGISFTNFALKAWVFHSRFFEGTGKPLSFDLLVALKDFIEMLVSIGGVSLVSPFWVGIDFSAMPLPMKLCGILFAATIATVFGFALWLNRSPPATVRPALAVAALALSGIAITGIILPGLIGRFLFVPYVGLLLAISAAFGSLSLSKNVRRYTIIALLIGGAGLDTPFRYYAKDSYLMYYTSILEDAKRQIIDARNPDIKYVVVESPDGILANFALNPWFLQIYDPGATYDVGFDTTPPSLRAVGPFDRARRYYGVINDHLIDVTGDAFAHALASNPQQIIVPSSFRCVAAPQDGPASTVSSATVAGYFGPFVGFSLPSGQSCVAADLGSFADAQLAFVVRAQPDVTASAALLSVRVVLGRNAEIVLRSEPISTGSDVQWYSFSFPIRDVAHEPIRIEFDNTPPVGSIFPTNLIVGEPALVVPQKARGIETGLGRT